MGEHVEDGADRLGGSGGRAGHVQMRQAPTDPAMPRPRRPSGEAARMASARPGAWRSTTAAVPSGVWSRGPNPVPPLVTTSPAKPSAARRRASATACSPSGTVIRSTTVNPAPASKSASDRAGPVRGDAGRHRVRHRHDLGGGDTGPPYRWCRRVTEFLRFVRSCPSADDAPGLPSTRVRVVRPHRVA